MFAMVLPLESCQNLRKSPTAQAAKAKKKKQKMSLAEAGMPRASAREYKVSVSLIHCLTDIP